MQISSKAEYACVAMIELAANGGETAPVPINRIAVAHGISQYFLVQVLLQLSKADLVVSTRGREGGYKLTRPADQITLADIIGAVDKRVRSSAKALQTKAAKTPAVEVLLSVWRQVQEQEQHILESTTLAELVRRSQRDSAPTYQI
jgi:Rrf2 family cysteine metabolism transcriptional repressor